MVADWLWTSWTTAGLVVLSALLMLAAVIAIVRVVGLRSFSKMSSFDFAVTIAIGSVLANVVVTSTSFIEGVLGVGALLGAQWTISMLRRRTTFERFVDNTPLLLMCDGELLDDALDVGRVSRSDVIAKLREANVLQLSEVRAVILEATGDVTVLHGDDEVDDVLLEGVRRV